MMRSIGKTGVFIIGVCMVISALILGVFFYNAQKPESTINVVGQASRRYESDTVKWSISLEQSVGLDGIKDGYDILKDSLTNLLEILNSKGIANDEININPIDVLKDYGQDGVRGYILQQSLYVISNDVDTVEALALDPSELLERDIAFRGSRLEYFYSQVDELKKDLIGDATVNARERAEKMLEDTNVKLGKTLSVKAGVFQITEPYSTSVASYGIYDTSTRKKQITVTAHVTFALR